MWPEKASWRIWFISATWSCAVRVVRRMRLPRRAVGSRTKGGQWWRRGEFPVGLEEDVDAGERGEALAKPVGEHLGDGELDLFDVAHGGGHQRAGGVLLEEFVFFADQFVEGALAEVGDGGEADEVDEEVAEVIRDALGEEDEEDGDGDEGPDVVDRQRDELIEVESDAGPFGDGEQDTGLGGFGLRTRSKIGRNRCR
jgi:hypothetical protein